MRREIAYARLPDVSYAGYAEAARTSQTLGQAMDRIVSFASKEAAVDAEIRGTEYGAQKSPTQQQLLDAVEQGTDPEDLIPGDSFTIFGQAARKQALATLANTMEIDARSAITQLQTVAAETNMTSDQLIYQMNELLDGYESTLIGVSPSLGKKFRASMGIVGNTVISAHSKKLLSDQESRDKVAALAAMDEVITSIEDIVSEPIHVSFAPSGAEGEIVTADEILYVQRQSIIQYGYAVGDKSLVDAKLKAFDEAVDEAKVGALVRYVKNDPLTNYKSLTTGEKPARVKQEDWDAIMQTWASMTPQQRDAARDGARDAFKDELSLEQTIDTREDKRLSELADGLELQISEARINGETETVEALLTALKRVDPKRGREQMELVYTTGGITNAEVKGNLYLMALDGVLTKSDILEAKQSGQLSTQDEIDLIKVLGGNRTDDYNKAIDYAKQKLGYPPGVQLNYTSKQRKARAEVADLAAELMLKQRTDPDADLFDLVSREGGRVEQILNDRNKISDSTMASYKAQIKELGTGGFGMDADATFQEIYDEAVERAANGDWSQMNSYRSAFDAVLELD